MTKPHVIIHPADMTQSDWVRCILPMMPYLFRNERMIFPSITNVPCTNENILKNASAVILQKPTTQVRANMAMMYAQKKKECGFKLVTDMDDLQWDLSPVIKEYAGGVQNPEQEILMRLKRMLPLFDTVVCSTRYLARRIKSDIGVNAVVMPNAVSRSLFGYHKTEKAFEGKPRVMYAGSLGHMTEKNLGDFEGPWVSWLRKNIEEGKIDFYIFGNPKFLDGLEGKYTRIEYTDMMSFPSLVASFRPDFYLAPLCNCNFNKAKSDLKLKEAAVLGSVFMGSDFADSPYSAAPKEQLVNAQDTPETLDEKFWKLCEPENYMRAIQWQNQALEEKHWLYEDPEYQKKFIATYMGV